MKAEHWKQIAAVSALAIPVLCYMGFCWERDHRHQLRQKRKESRKESSIDIGGR